MKDSGLVAVPLTGKRLPDRQVFVKVLHGTLLSEVSCCVPITSQDPLGGEQPLQANRTPGVDASRADTNLRSWKESQQKGIVTECAVV